MKIKYSLNDVFPQWLTNGGVFSLLSQFDVPWKNKITDKELNWDYHGNKSGDKVVSSLVASLIDDDGIISTADKQTLAQLIFNKYGLQWNKRWETLFFDYNPIENYNRKEETIFEKGEQDNEFHKGQQANTMTKGSETDSIQYGETVSSQTKGEQTNSTTNVIGEVDTTTAYGEQGQTTENEVSAFNSSIYSDDRKTNSSTDAHMDTTTTASHTDTINETEGNRTDSQTVNQHTDTSTRGSREDTSTEGSREDLSFEGSRTDTTKSNVSGNIGVMSTQDMIQQERSIWDYNYFEKVFSDIDEILTINIFI